MHTILKFLFSLCIGAVLMPSTSCSQGSVSAEADANTARTDSAIVIDNILNRRSIRAYTDQPVERQKLEVIARCGINAPSGMNSQPWQVRIIDSPAYIDSLTAIFKKLQPERAEQPGFKNMFRNAPALIFVASPSNGSGQVDCGLMGENMVLAAEAMGLCTCIQGGPLAFMKNTKECAPYIQQLQIPEDYELLYIIGVGYPDETPDAKPRDESKVKFID